MSSKSFYLGAATGVLALAANNYVNDKTDSPKTPEVQLEQFLQSWSPEEILKVHERIRDAIKKALSQKQSDDVIKKLRAALEWEKLTRESETLSQ